jgi:hypothetical protein
MSLEPRIISLEKMKMTAIITPMVKIFQLMMNFDSGKKVGIFSNNLSPLLIK